MLTLPSPCSVLLCPFSLSINRARVPSSALSLLVSLSFYLFLSLLQHSSSSLLLSLSTPTCPLEISDVHVRFRTHSEKLCQQLKQQKTTTTKTVIATSITSTLPTRCHSAIHKQQRSYEVYRSRNAFNGTTATHPLPFFLFSFSLSCLYPLLPTSATNHF